MQAELALSLRLGLLQCRNVAARAAVQLTRESVSLGVGPSGNDLTGLQKRSDRLAASMLLV